MKIAISTQRMNHRIRANPNMTLSMLNDWHISHIIPNNPTPECFIRVTKGLWDLAHAAAGTITTGSMYDWVGAGFVGTSAVLNEWSCVDWRNYESCCKWGTVAIRGLTVAHYEVDFGGELSG